MEIFYWIETSFLSIWFRETIWAFPILLVSHALGMAFLVGTSVTINLRLLGLAAKVTLSSLLKFYPVIYFSFAINLVSGLFLLLAYPAKALTNPIFFLKIGLIILALILTHREKSLLANSHANISTSHKITAVFVLLLWTFGIISGRFLAYTHSWLLVS